MQRGTQTVSRAEPRLVLQTNSVVRNTYILLSLTLLFSAFTAWLSMSTRSTPLGLSSMLVYMGLLFLTQALKNSAWGIAAVFALTGFLGYTLGPLLNTMIYGYSNGGQLVMTALGLTGLIFFVLSGYALTTRKDFSYLAGFLFAAVIIAFIASLSAVFLNIPLLHIGVSAAFVLISSGLILFETSQIINGGERNYIMATISLYASIYNLFVSLLQLLAVFGGRRD
jgi:modulator of FtsH protease